MAWKIKSNIPEWISKLNGWMKLKDQTLPTETFDTNSPKPELPDNLKLEIREYERPIPWQCERWLEPDHKPGETIPKLSLESDPDTGVVTATFKLDRTDVSILLVRMFARTAVEMIKEEAILVMIYDHIYKTVDPDLPKFGLSEQLFQLDTLPARMCNFRPIVDGLFLSDKNYGKIASRAIAIANRHFPASDPKAVFGKTLQRLILAISVTMLNDRDGIRQMLAADASARSQHAEYILAKSRLLLQTPARQKMLSQLRKNKVCWHSGVREAIRDAVRDKLGLTRTEYRQLKKLVTADPGAWKHFTPRELVGEIRSLAIEKDLK